MKRLLIVESPNKIKKLKEYLGSDWEVKASVGHICDLPKKDLGVDKANNFKPTYVVSEDKEDVVKGLKSAIASVGKENVYLATDPDREGEAISFHLCRTLGLDYKTTKRVSFDEITKKALDKAINNPKNLNIPLVTAQEARRVIDRLFGYEISDIVRRKVKSETSLSAGRVQSVAVKLIVEREREIQDFGATSTYKVSGFFSTPASNKLKAFASFDFQDLEVAKKYLSSTDGKKFAIKSIAKTPKKTNPLPPFSTSTLQQDANKRLKFSVDHTMKVAQKLFEGGHITYMRTDSVNLSDEAIEKLSVFITETFGAEYLETRKFQNKNESAQEAHEAIRPSVFTNKDIEGTEDEKALYNLIYMRAVASQMKAKETATTTITIDSSEEKDEFKAKASILTFDGYTRAYADIVEEDEKDEEDEEAEIKEQLNEKDPMQLLSVTANQSYKRPKSRFGEADLVKELEARGIGRPSTFASIIRNIKDIRNYVFVGKAEGKRVDVMTITYESGKFLEKKSTTTLGGAKDKMLPNEIAYTLVDFLQDGFNLMMDYEFTAKCEETFDKIANRQEQYVTAVSSIYSKLSECLTQTDSKHKDVEGKERKTVDVGEYQKEKVRAGKGEKGVYVLFKEDFYNVPEVSDHTAVTLEMAIKAITDKKEAEKKKKEEKAANTLHTFGKYKVFKTEKGIFIEKGEDTCPFPKWDLDKVDTYNEEKCKEAMTKFKAWKKSQNKK